METKNCPYCGETINAEASKCRFCKEWLTGSPEISVSSEIESHYNHLLQHPQGSYYWGWVLVLIFLISLVVTKIEGGLDITSALLLFLVGWGFVLLDKYMDNFQQKIVILKILPFFYWVMGVLTFISAGSTLQDDTTIIDMITIVVGIGSLVCELIASWQLMKFKYDIVGGIKTLGIYLFIINLILIFVLLLLLLLSSLNEDVTDFVEINLWCGIFFSVITVFFIMNIFYKARRYNKTGFDDDGHPRPKFVQRNIRGSNKKGVAGFVLALFGLLIGWVPVLGWILWILGLIFSSLGMSKQPKGLAVAGFVISCIAVIIIIAVSKNLH